ncbi:hypothetical protein LTR95_017897 [Oleoguttula sp. CCFEE 5521]
MTLTPPPFELPRDEWLRESWMLQVTHEFGHSIGFVHEHQRPGAVNVNGEAPNAPIRLAIENIPGYQETAVDILQAPEPAFTNMNVRQRMLHLVPRVEGRLSIGYRMIPFASLSQYPPLGPDNQKPPNNHLVWVGGNPSPAIGGISELDMARLYVMYPPSDLHQPVARGVAADNATGYRPAFRPVRVTMGNSTVTVRPAGPIPTGNDCAAAMGPMWQDPNKILGLGMFGGPYAPGSLSKVSNDVMLRGAAD